MEITEIKVFPVEEEKLRAFVSIVFDQCFMVNDIKVIKGREGLFISMPSRRKRNGRFKDVAHPLNNETRRVIEDRILGEYERAISGREEVGALSPAPAAEATVGEAPKVEVRDEPAPEEKKTLDEVAELHLRDSFWSP